MIQVKPIRTEEDLDTALSQAETLLERGEPSDELDVLLVLIEHYERLHHSIPPGDPLEVIRFKLRELGISQNEAARLANIPSGRFSELLSGKRELTISTVRAIGQALGIPLGALVGSSSTRSVLVEVPAALADRARHLAASRGMSFGDWISACIRQGCSTTRADTITDEGLDGAAAWLANQLGHPGVQAWTPPPFPSASRDITGVTTPPNFSQMTAA